jgi:hypothetical protein
MVMTTITGKFFRSIYGLGINPENMLKKESQNKENKKKFLTGYLH